MLGAAQGARVAEASSAHQRAFAMSMVSWVIVRVELTPSPGVGASISSTLHARNNDVASADMMFLMRLRGDVRHVLLPLDNRVRELTN